jgi:excisionase family DNA binding protein
MIRIPGDHLLVAGEIATILRISRSSAYRLMESGELACLKIGGARRVPPESLMAYIKKSGLDPNQAGIILVDGAGNGNNEKDQNDLF